MRFLLLNIFIVIVAHYKDLKSTIQSLFPPILPIHLKCARYYPICLIWINLYNFHNKLVAGTTDTHIWQKRQLSQTNVE